MKWTGSASNDICVEAARSLARPVRTMGIVPLNRPGGSS
jgi:hypothetical protein